MSNLTSRTITGIVMVFLGLVLAVVAFFTSLFFLIYSLILLVIGLFILFNKKEDSIEEIKNSNERGKHKR